MDYKNLILDQMEDIAIITLNRPSILNALSSELSNELLAVFAEVGNSDDIRAVVITGAGRGFCSGVDLSVSRPSADDIPIIMGNGCQCVSQRWLDLNQGRRRS